MNVNKDVHFGKAESAQNFRVIQNSVLYKKGMVASMKTVALVGLPNCGKSTLFNRLTGLHQTVGNFPGVTVAGHEGVLRKDQTVKLVDLPGLYSLNPYTQEERVTRDFLLDTPPDVILQILDATNPTRHLYLTLQLLELHIPVVLACNFADELRARGQTLDVDALSARLGCPAVPISASDGEGVDALLAALRSPVCAHSVRLPHNGLSEQLYALQKLLQKDAEREGLPTAFVASGVFLGQDDLLARLHMDAQTAKAVETLCAREADPALRLVQARYDVAEKIGRSVLSAPRTDISRRRTDAIDRWMTHPLVALPLFACILAAVFCCTFTLFGAFLQDLTALGIRLLGQWAGVWLERLGCHALLRSLLLDGVLAGVGSVLSFFPILLVMFFFLTLLEDSGYLARVAFVLDRPMRKIGLSGKALVSVLLGFGCTVPAVLSVRTMAGKRERFLTLLLLPFAVCCAKIPLLVLLGGMLFPQNRGVALPLFYAGSILLGLLCVSLLSRLLPQEENAAFLLELPPYRLPSLPSTFCHVWEKTKDFLHKTFTVVFLSTVVVWFLRTFGLPLRPVASEESLLAHLSGGVGHLLSPLGFGDWRLAAALLCGICAKESAVSTLAVLFGTAEGDLAAVLQTVGALPNIASMAAFAVFFLLYVPCVASLSVLRREYGSRVKLFGCCLFQLAVAWITAFLTHAACSLLL